MEKYDEKKNKIFVDADACPVKEEIVSIAGTYNINVVFVASYAHVMSNPIGGKWVYVDADKEAADLYIMNHAIKKDIVITQDTGLASILVNRGVTVLSPRGKEFKEEDMEQILHFRFLSAKERRSGSYSKGPKPFTDEDKQHFTKIFKKSLSNIAGF
ncbi:YaiI/YqxD family protein [Fredinandcohnia sp. QZ13]|uniref:YaiI/YqxD family protein n=1 Tax=Fredinandcohnia sp. QZ13 TaxID=3073144 RepID=UPI0028533E64|nr:YaiI/YqxD family protein [Fredinandcohnia sp. QZ13]MDR4888974.1 YaiI/YqxD family protein [Fredinandcohnia sp. QZ13]